MNEYCKWLLGELPPDVEITYACNYWSVTIDYVVYASQKLEDAMYAAYRELQPKREERTWTAGVLK